MALFVIERGSTLPAARAWDLLTDWRRHGRVAPLTAVRVRSGPPGGGLGTVFVARTRIGRLGFDDPMEVTAWR
ncbi:SRPBCC family protein, partial [Streptomyces sp. SID11233]|nr:SRPBCC family protein [Streptomyces sp. SID11233]